MKNHYFNFFSEKLSSHFSLKIIAAFSVILLGLIFFSCTRNQDSLLQKSSTNKSFVVAKSQAITIAEKFSFFKKSSLKSSDKSKGISLVKEIFDDNNEPLFYIINYDSTGFVVVSGDKRTIPILAFSKHHSFTIQKKVWDKTGIGYWINATKKGIMRIRHERLKQVSSVKYAWEEALGVKTLPIDTSCTNFTITYGPLMTTAWGQGCGYNTLLSESCVNNCGHVLTGCVATAMAQIMKYHAFPLSYNWSAMPDSSGSLETARLMRDIGTAVNMNYGCDASGASGNNIAPAFVNAFGYAATPQYIDYAGTNAYESVENEIANNRPVIFTGIDPNVGGHAWVSDGYRESHDCTFGLTYLYFHMNWGWESIADGWFGFNTFTPTDQSGNTYNFYTDSKVVINIHP